MPRQLNDGTPGIAARGHGQRLVVSGRRRQTRSVRGPLPVHLQSPQNLTYKFQSRESTAVKEHNGLSILKCSDVLHYNKNVTRGLRVRGNIIVGAARRHLQQRRPSLHLVAHVKKQLMGRKRFSVVKTKKKKKRRIVKKKKKRGNPFVYRTRSFSLWRLRVQKRKKKNS